MRDSHGFCKYRPSKLGEEDFHGIIVKYRPQGKNGKSSIYNDYQYCFESYVM